MAEKLAGPQACLYSHTYPQHCEKCKTQVSAHHKCRSKAYFAFFPKNSKQKSVHSTHNGPEWTTATAKHYRGTVSQRAQLPSHKFPPDEHLLHKITTTNQNQKPCTTNKRMCALILGLTEQDNRLTTHVPLIRQGLSP